MSYRILVFWCTLFVLAGSLALACGRPESFPMPAAGNPARRADTQTAESAPASSAVAEASTLARPDSASPGMSANRSLSASRGRTEGIAPTAGAKAGGNIGGPAPEAGGGGNPNNRALPLMYFENYGVNPFVDADEDHLSTFALDGDTASFAVARRYLRDGWLPPPEAVRVEEFVNAFEGGYPASRSGLSLHLDAVPSPFGQPGYIMLRVGVAAPAFPEEHDPVSLIFIVDVSGSMDYDNRLEAAKRIMLGLLDRTRPADRVALVVYGDRAEVIEPLRAGEDARDLRQSIRRLHPTGATNAEDGLRLAYELASDDMIRGRTVRLVLFSDGVGNVGETGPDQILEVVNRHAQRKATLTTVGVGLDGNYNDVMMERLANRGNGTYHYIDDREAEVEFLDGPAAAVFHDTAREARIQVEFNPGTVRKYRLLGYENRAKADDSFRDDTQDFGEIGFRSDVTALYEVRPLDNAPEGLMATARLRYRDVLENSMVEVEAALDWSDVMGEPDRHFRRQIAVAEWAELLAKSYYARCSTIEAVQEQLPAELGQADWALADMIERSLPLFEPYCDN